MHSNDLSSAVAGIIIYVERQKVCLKLSNARSVSRAECANFFPVEVWA